jgi:hypothetical protein
LAALKILPLVRRVASDIRECSLERSRYAKQASDCWTEGNKAESWRCSDRAEETQRRLDALLAEMKALDVVLLDPIRGDVGFPTIVNGALAYLVAQGEDADLRYWRYRDQPKLREIPPAWLAVVADPSDTIVESELVLD